mmetsp:Transcript_6351/g.14032  ORF Transcript_6351/g.14032 Transcript_6351/m.14032 type:complete len:243 (-) Transcript_6351:341-1069(-)
MAKAMDRPSMVEVPLPSSSISTRERSVRLASTYEASFISVKKVLILCSMSSLLPRRDSSLSRTGRVACLAGTKQPICAIITINAVCFMYTVLPDPLGPVTMCIFSSGLRNRSLLMNDDASWCVAIVETTGWRPAFMTMGPSGVITGRVNGCGERATRSAKDESMSSIATLSVSVNRQSMLVRRSAKRAWISSCVRLRACVMASLALSDSELNSSVLQLMERRFSTACVNPSGRGSSSAGTDR